MSCIRALLAQCVVIAVVLPAIGIAQTKSWSGGGDNNNWTNPLNWIGGVAPAPGDALVFDTFARLTPNNNYGAGTLFNGITFGPSAGPFVLAGNAITLGGNITDNTPVLSETINLPLALAATPTVAVGSDASLVLGSPVSGAFGLTKTGNGTLTLSAANSFSGPLTINAGVVSVSADNNLGGVPAAASPGRIVINGGTLRAVSGFTTNSNRGIALGPTAGAGGGTIEVVQGGASFDVTTYTGAVTATYSGVIANNGGGTGALTKEGFGRLILGGANTYTGPTTIKVGTLSLDFASAAAPTSNIINPASSLTLGGSTAGLGHQTFSALIAQGANGETNSQTFNGTTIANGPTHIIANSGTGGATNLNLGALTHNTGGVVKFVLPASGNISTTTANTNGIIGGWATVGVGAARPDNPPGALNRKLSSTTFATVDGGNIRGLRDNEYTIATTGNNLATYVTAATNLNIDNSSTGSIRVDSDAAGTITDINTLRFSEVSPRSIRIGAGNTLRLGKSGAVFRSDFATTPTWAIGSSDGGANGVQDEGTLTAGGPGAGAGEIVFIMNSPDESAGSLNVEAVVADNPAGGAVSVVKMGAGSMKFRAHNTYSGDTYILEGRFQLAGTEIGTGNPAGWGTGTVHVFPGAQAFPSGVGDFGVTGQAIPNNFRIAGLGTAEEAFAAIRFGNGTRISGDITLQGDSRLAGGNTASVANTGVSGKISGPFNLDFGALATINSNLSIFNPANDWTGTTTLHARNTATPNILRIGANEVIPHGVGKGNVVMNGNTNTGTVTLDLSGFNETINALITTPNNPAGAIVSNNAAATTSTLTLGAYDQSGVFNGIIRDGTTGGVVALTKIGTGVQTLGGANLFTGPVNINTGTLSITGTIAAPLGSLTIPVINVNASAGGAGTLAGTGSVLDIVVGANSGANKARVSPGATGAFGAVGTLTATSYTANGGDLQVDLVTPVAGSSDLVTVNGPVSFTAPSTISPIGGVAGAYTILTTTAGAINYAGGQPTVVPVVDPELRPTSYTPDFSDPSSIKLNVTGGGKSLTWTGAINSNWDHAALNWTDGAMAERFFKGDAVTFADGPASRDVNVTATVQPAAITVNNSTGNDYTIGGPGVIAGSTGITKQGGGILTLSSNNTYAGTTAVNGGTLVHAADTSTSGATTIASGATVRVGIGGTTGTLGNGPVTNDGLLIFDRSNDAAAVNAIAGAGELRKIGTNRLTLSGASTYTGPTNVTSGTVIVTNAGAGASSLGALQGDFVTPGVVNISAGAALDLAGATGANSLDFFGKQFNIVGAGVGGSGAITNSGTVAQLNAFQRITLTGNATVGGTGRFDMRDIRDPDVIVPSLDLAGFTLTKTGTGQFTLVGTNVTDGNIVVNEGIFAIETTSSVPDLGTGKSITYNAGTTAQFFNLQPGALTRPLVFNGEGSFIGNASGQASTVNSNITLNGSITVTNLNNSTGALNLEGVIGETGGPRSLTKAGGATLNLNNLANTYSGPTTITGGNINAGSIVDGGLPSSIGQSSSAAPNLVLAGGNLTFSGVFSGASSNRLFTVGPGTGGLESNGGAGNAMSFTNTGPIAVVGPNATLLLTGTNTDNNLIAPKLVDGAEPLSLRKSGAGTWILTNSNTYTGTTSVDEGLLRITGSINSNNAVTIAAPGILEVHGTASSVGGVSGAGTAIVGNGTAPTTLNADHVRLASLTINAASQVKMKTSGGTSVIGTLAIAGDAAPTAKLDLNNNAAIVDYPDGGPNPVTTIRAQIISGRGGSGLNKTWNGMGITSSQAAADPVNAGSIGYAVNGTLPLGPYTSFGGQPVDTSAVIMRYTRTADANLDGVVNNDDVAVVGANYAPGSPKPRWDLGDFDYNGFVDNDDITLLGAFYNPGAPPIPTPAQSDSVSAVPEPSSLVVGGLGALGLLVGYAVRRRRS